VARAETYLRADAVTVLSDDLRDNVAAKIAGRRGGRASGQGPGDPQLHRHRLDPPGRTGERLPARARPQGKTVVMYAGNVGFSQSLDLVLAAAAHLATTPTWCS
jgi:colanic acid biosynthesis glycosyl transferase WcaI